MHRSGHNLIGGPMNATYTARPFQNEADYDLMRQLLIETYPLDSPPLNCLVGEIDWWRSTADDPELMSKVRLWFDDVGALVAFVWPRSDEIEVMIHPNHRKLEEQILLMTESQFAQSLKAKEAGSDEHSLHYWSYEQDHVRNAMLQTFGYQRVEDEFLACHRLDVTDAPAPGPLPAGYTVRGFAGEREIQSRVDAHRSAFHPSKMTVEKHRKVMASPTYRQALDIVCVAADGAIAACTIVWFDAVNRVGIFEPVACHADHQRRGLASAVMIEGLRRIHALGGTVAQVMSHRDDSPGAHTYRSLGFKMIGRLYQWKKEIVMTSSQKTLRTCPQGHTFHKSSDCPTCPTCEADARPETGFLSKLSNPARSALEAKGITTLTELAQYSEREILKLHGMGPRSIPTLRKELMDAGLSFKDVQVRKG